MEKAVLYQRQDRVGVITLNRGDNRNSMTPELLEAFAEATAEARADAEARCVIITGRGRCFSAGADFRSNIQTGAEALMPHERSYAMYQPFLSVLDIEVPVIAAMNGHAVGGGFGLALVCDIRIAHSTSKYGANFTKLGLHPGMAVTYLLPRILGASVASELLYTAKLVSGDEAARIGLASSSHDDDVATVAMEMARAIAANAPIAVRMTKRSIRDQLGWNVRSAARSEALAQAATLETPDAAEGMAALLEKRTPEFDGSSRKRE